MFGIATRIHRALQLLMVPQARHLRRRELDYDPFQRYNLRWLKSLNIGLVVDIGANRGDFSALLHEVLPAATIVAFEPLPECYEQLRRRLSYIPNLTARNVAIGDVRGFIEFYRSSWAPASSALPMAETHKLNFPFSSINERIRVACLPLDEALADIRIPGAVMVKMDVQGYEDRVIAGGHKTLERASVVWIETSFVEQYEGQALFDTVYHQLRALGLEFRGNHEQLCSPIDDSVLQADSIFVRPSPKGY